MLVAVVLERRVQTREVALSRSTHQLVVGARARVESKKPPGLFLMPGDPAFSIYGSMEKHGLCGSKRDSVCQFWTHVL